MEQIPDTVTFNLHGLPRDFWRRVKAQAEADSISLSQLGYKLFAEYLAKREKVSK